MINEENTRITILIFPQIVQRGLSTSHPLLKDDNSKQQTKKESIFRRPSWLTLGSVVLMGGSLALYLSYLDAEKVRRELNPFVYIERVVLYCTRRQKRRSGISWLLQWQHIFEISYAGDIDPVPTADMQIPPPSQKRPS